MGYIANPRTYTLSLSPYSLTFVVPAENTTQRVLEQSYSISYSSTNAAIVDNGLRDNDLYHKYRWNLTGVRLVASDWDILQRIFAMWEASPTTPIELDDNCRPIAEPVPRSRPLATGAVEVADATTTIYKAKFNVGFSQGLELETILKGGTVLVSFQLSELDKLNAA